MILNINNFIDTVSPGDSTIIVRTPANAVLRTLKVTLIGATYVMGNYLSIRYNSGENLPINLQFNSSSEANQALVIFQQQLDVAKNINKTSSTENNFICIDYLTFKTYALQGKLIGQQWYLVNDVTNLLGGIKYKTLTMNNMHLECIFAGTDGILYKVHLNSDSIVVLDGNKVFEYSGNTIYEVNHRLNRIKDPLVINNMGHKCYPKITIVNSDKMILEFSEIFNGKVYF
jgi:hypothetical protein